MWEPEDAFLMACLWITLYALIGLMINWNLDWQTCASLSAGLCAYLFTEIRVAWRTSYGN